MAKKTKVQFSHLLIKNQCFQWFKQHIYKCLSLKQVFSIIVLINSVAILLCATAGYRIYTTAYNKLLFDSMESSLSVTSAQISQAMENVEYISTLILSSSSIQKQLSHVPDAEDIPKMQEFNRIVNNALSDYSALFRSNYIAYAALFTKTTVNSTNWALLKRTPAFLMSAAITNGEKQNGAVTWTSSNRGKYLLLSRSVREIDKLSLKPLGNLVIAVDMESLVDSAVQFTSSHPGQKFVFSTRKGTLLYVPDDISSLEASQLLQESSDHSWKLLTLHGHKYFAIKGALPHYDYQYLSLAPYDEIAEALRFSLCLLVLILASGILAILYISNRLITAIIHQFDLLISRMETFSRDELALPSPKESDSIASIENQPREIRSLHHNFSDMAQRIRELVQINYVNKLLAKDAQLQALRSQISPHFLYNTLETINWRAKAVGDQKISQIAESLGSLLRASLSSQKPLVMLSYELELVDSFITIQKIRFEDQLEFRSQVSPEALNGRIPPLTIQPLVENAIHYGMEEMTEVCHIDLTAEITDGILCIRVRNEGSQFEEDLLNKLRKKTRQPNGFGIGLLNIDQRIRLIFGEDYGLSLSNENGFAIAALRLPFRTQDMDLTEEPTC